MGKVIAICTSPEKGTQKTRIEEGTFIEECRPGRRCACRKMASSDQSSFL